MLYTHVASALGSKLFIELSLGHVDSGSGRSCKHRERRINSIRECERDREAQRDVQSAVESERERAGG